MKTHLLNCKKLTAGLVYPPYKLQQAQVNQIYAEITQRHPFQSLQHLPDGARMANPNGDFFIQTTRMQVNDEAVHFHASKEKALDLFTMAQDKLQIPQFVTFGVKLTAFMPLDDGQNAAELLRGSVFSAVDPSFQKLGDGFKGAGMRIVLHKDGVHEVKIEPFFSDLTQLYVEVDVQHPSHFTDVRDTEKRMDAVYDFLFGEVADFLGSL